MIRRWKKLGERTRRISPYRHVRDVRYRMPNGQIKNFTLFLRGQVVCALVMTADKHVVVAKQFRLGPARSMYELPGGAVERDETPREAVTREVLEETGYRGQTKMVGVSTNDAWSVLRRFHFVITQARPVSVVRPDDGEDITVCILSLKKFLRHLRQGNMTDAETAYRGLEYLDLL